MRMNSGLAKPTFLNLKQPGKASPEKLSSSSSNAESPGNS